jgi:hypothetical protein
VKAYALPGAQGKGYLERGLVKNVSWRGKVVQELFQQGVRIKKFAIESIDLARPRSAGMSARLVGALTSEMAEEGEEGVKPEEIAALSANELRAHNPALVTTIEADARKPLEEQVSEMSTSAEAVKPVVAEIPDIRKLLGLANETDDVTVLKSAIEFIRTQGKTIRDSILDSVLKSKKLDVNDPNAKLARRIIIGEMTEFQPTGDSAKDEQTVSEMEGAPPNPPEGTKPDPTTSRELKPGLTTSTIRVRSLTR